MPPRSTCPSGSPGACCGPRRSPSRGRSGIRNSTVGPRSPPRCAPIAKPAAPPRMPPSSRAPTPTSTGMQHGPRRLRGGGSRGRGRRGCDGYGRSGCGGRLRRGQRLGRFGVGCCRRLVVGHERYLSSAALGADRVSLYVVRLSATCGRHIGFPYESPESSGTGAGPRNPRTGVTVSAPRSPARGTGTDRD